MKLVHLLLNTNTNLSLTGVWTMFSIGILCLILGIMVFFLYKKKLSNQKDNSTFNLSVKSTKYQMFHFWNNAVFLFLIFTLFIGALVLLGVSISSMF